MKLVLTALVMVGLAACAPDETPDCRDANGVAVLTYDPASFTLEELPRLASVETKWNAFVGRTVVRIEPDDKVGNCTVRKNPEYGVGKAHLGHESTRASAIDVGTPYDCQTALLPGADCFEAIVMHEAGHVLGLKHTTDHDSVMFKQTYSIHFGSGDEEICRAASLCK